MSKWCYIENMFTVAAMGAAGVGLYTLGAGAHSLWPLVLLLNINYPR